MFSSPLPPVVCGKDHALFTFLCLFAYSGVQHILCFVFLRIVYRMLQISLDNLFVIAPSIFSNVYVKRISISMTLSE